MDTALFNATDCTLTGDAQAYLTLFLVNPDAPCSGHGTCKSGICVCDSGWHGESDMVNLAGYACHVQTITRQLFWAVVLLIWAVVWFINVSAFVHKYGEWKRLNGLGSPGKQPALKYFPFQILVPGVFIVVPLVLATAILKIFTNQAIGVDVPVTLCFSFGSLGSFFVSAHNQGHQFKMLTRGRMMNSMKLARIVSKFTNGARISQVVYIIAKLFQIGATGAQESGPLSAPVVGLLLGNNIFTFMYFIMYGVMAHSVMTSVAELLVGSSSTGAGVSKSQLSKVLSFMKTTVKQSRLAIVAMTLLYVIHSLPWLFGYQTFAYSLALIIAFPTYAKQSTMFLAARKGGNNENTTSTFNTLSSNKRAGFSTMTSSPRLMNPRHYDVKKGSTFELKADGRVMSAKGSFNEMDSMSMLDADMPSQMETRNPSFSFDENDDEVESQKKSGNESNQWDSAREAAKKYNAGW